MTRPLIRPDQHRPAIDALIAKAYAAGFITDAECEGLVSAANHADPAATMKILMAAFARQGAAS